MYKTCSKHSQSTLSGKRMLLLVLGIRSRRHANGFSNIEVLSLNYVKFLWKDIAGRLFGLCFSGCGRLQRLSSLIAVLLLIVVSRSQDKQVRDFLMGFEILTANSTVVLSNYMIGSGVAKPMRLMGHNLYAVNFFKAQSGFPFELAGVFEVQSCWGSIVVKNYFRRRFQT